MVDIRDTKGFFLDLTLDDEGLTVIGGAQVALYSEELNQGDTPNKLVQRIEEDSKLEEVNLSDPTGLTAGTQIRNTSRGPEVSKTIYDARYSAALVTITAEFNTPDAERVMGLIDGTTYAKGTFQNKTVDDVIKFIVARSEGLLLYDDGSAPKDFAGPVSLRNTPLPQAISQVLAVEGNNIWTVDPDDRKTVIVINRNPAAEPITGIKGELGVNVVETSLTGVDARGGRGALVKDKDGKGDKKQYGGPAYYGSDGARDGEDTFGAPKPLELRADLRELKKAAKKAINAPGDQINECYGYIRFINDVGEEITEWKHPINADGTAVPHYGFKLVQKETIGTNLLTTTGRVGKKFDPNLLTHPNLGIVVEVKIAAPPEIFLAERVKVGPEADRHKKELQAKIDRANGKGGRITAEIAGVPSGRKALLTIIESDIFEVENKNQGKDKIQKIGIAAFYTPEWQPVDCLVDYELGEFIIPPGQMSENFHGLCSAFNVGAGEAIEIGFKQDPEQPGIIHNYVKVNFVEGVKNAEFRAHLVVADALDHVVRPAGSKTPYGAIEEGPYERHNVIFNKARIEGFIEPDTKVRDDTDIMVTRAENLATSISIPGQAKGAITIFPGDRRLRIGDPANGGTVVKILHTFAPYFITKFWLEGTPDIDEPAQKVVRRKIGEYQNTTEINSARTLEEAKRSVAGRGIRGGGQRSRIPPHTHQDQFSGGNQLGAVTVDAIEVKGNSKGDLPAITARRGKHSALVDLKYLTGFNRMISGDLLVEIVSVTLFPVDDQRLVVKVWDDEDSGLFTNIEGVFAVIDGELVVENLDLIFAEGEVYPLMFIESGTEEEQKEAPKPCVFVSGRFLRCDHIRDDEGVATAARTRKNPDGTTTFFPAKIANQSTKVSNTGETGASGEKALRFGDVDDITKVIEITGTGDVSTVITEGSKVRWANYMYPRAHTSAAGSAGGFDARSWWLTCGRFTGGGDIWGYLSDVFEFHDPLIGGGQTFIDIKTQVHFKKTAISGKPILDGPLDFRTTSTSVQYSPVDVLRGYLALDTTREQHGGKGTWTIDVPLDLCALEQFTDELEKLVRNDELVFAILKANDDSLFVAIGETRDQLKDVRDAMIVNDLALFKAINDAITCFNAAIAALAGAVSGCACCFAEAPACPAIPAGLVEPPVTDPERIVLEPELEKPCEDPEEAAPAAASV